MSDPSPRPEAAPSAALRFHHGRIALLVLGGLILILVALTVLDHIRKDEQEAQLAARLCGPLPAQLEQALQALTPAEQTQSVAARKALSLWLTGASEAPGDTEAYATGRLLFQTHTGWRQQQAHDEQLGWTHEPALLALAAAPTCDVSRSSGQIRVARSLTTSAGVAVILVFERSVRH